jgi:hypothetical protein
LTSPLIDGLDDLVSERPEPHKMSVEFDRREADDAFSASRPLLMSNSGIISARHYRMIITKRPRMIAPERLLW